MCGSGVCLDVNTSPLVCGSTAVTDKYIFCVCVSVSICDIGRIGYICAATFGKRFEAWNYSVVPLLQVNFAVNWSLNTNNVRVCVLLEYIYFCGCIIFSNKLFYLQ